MTAAVTRTGVSRFVRGGIKAMMVSAALCSASPASADEAPASAAPATSSGTPSAPSSPMTEPTAEPSKRTAWPWIIGGTGLSLIITAGVLEILAVSENKKSDDAQTQLFSVPQGDPSRKSLQDTADSHHQSAKSEETAALIIGAAGFLAVAGSVVWWFFESPSGTPTTPAASLERPRLMPSLAPGYGGATFGATF